MIPALVRIHTLNQNKTAGTTILPLIDSQPVVAGNLLVARILFDNAATASKPIVSSISKPANETATWVFLGAARSTSTSAGSFVSGELWCIQTTVDWPTAQYTVTLDTSVTQKAASFSEFSGAQAVLRSTVGTAYSTTTTAASATTTGTTPVVNDLVISWIFGSNVATPPAGDNDTTGGAWISTGGIGSAGGNVATNNYGLGQYKVLTTAAHQTLNNSATMTAGNGAIVAILQSSPDPLVTQAAYCFYADGTETDSTALAAQDTAATINAYFNAYFQVRILMQATTSAPRASDLFVLQWEKNASGTWNNATGGSTVISPYLSANVVDGAVTTNRLTGGTGSFNAGRISEDGGVDSVSGWVGNNYTEFLYSLQIAAADVVHGDTLRLRVLFNGVTTPMTYSSTPTINVIKIPIWSATITTNWGGWNATAIGTVVTVAVTQAAYRFYADGTESGSTALAAQDTAPTIDVTSGDVPLQLRTRLQSTSVTSLPSTDDWQLQWEKNASGTWLPLLSSGFIDRYDFSNAVFTGYPMYSSQIAIAQSFQGDGRPLSEVDFYLNREGTLTGTVGCVLYSFNGSIPTGTLATSPTTVTASSIPTSRIKYTFSFPDVALNAGTTYCIGLTLTGGAASPNYVRTAYDNTSSTHPGILFYNNGSVWTTYPADLVFEVRSSASGGPIVSYDSTNLTDASTTTNRLTGGTGTFQAGKVSEDGLVDDLGWSGNDFTELLYSIQLKSVDLANGDMLRLRVLRNGGTTYMTYGVTPTINITKTELPPALTQHAYRFYADGTETGSVALAEQNTAYTADVTSGDVSLLLRVGIQSTNQATDVLSVWRLEFDRNDDVWNPVLSATIPYVNSFDSANLTEGTPTTSRLTGGTGSFQAGSIGEGGSIIGVYVELVKDNHTEFLFTIKLKSADLINGNILRFRVRDEGNGLVVTHAQTPTINVTKSAAAPDWPATITSNWSGGDASALIEEHLFPGSTLPSGWEHRGNGALSVSGGEIHIDATGGWAPLIVRARPGGTTYMEATMRGTGSGDGWHSMHARWGSGTAAWDYGTNDLSLIRGTGATGGPPGRWEFVATGGSSIMVGDPTVKRVYGIRLNSDTSQTLFVDGVEMLTSTVDNNSALTLAGVGGANNVITHVERVAFYSAVPTAGWMATAIGTVTAPTGSDIPAVISSNWGTWTATSTAGVSRGAAVVTSWGTWTATAVATVARPASITTSWGNWTATAIATVGRPAAVTTSWGTWTATAIGTVARPGAVTTSWGTWTATAVGTVTTPAAGIAGTITSDWGTWTATAVGTVLALAPLTLSAYRFFNDNASPNTSTALGPVNTQLSLVDADKLIQMRFQVCNTGASADSNVLDVEYRLNGGSWQTPPSAASPGAHPVTVADSAQFSGSVVLTGARIGPGIGTFVNGLGVESTASISQSLGAGNFTEYVVMISLLSANVVSGDAIDFRYVRGGSANSITYTQTPSIKVVADVSATITTLWGNWTATAAGSIVSGGRVVSQWSNYAQATTFAGALIGATVADNWGGWTATAVAQAIQRNATIASNWGTWTATAIGTRITIFPGVIASNWGTWTATAVAQPIDHFGFITTSWGGWTATGLATRITTGTATENWGGWVATAVGTRATPATITTSWGTWTATANGIVTAEEIFATAVGNWGGWTTATIAGVSHIGLITTTWPNWTATAVAQAIQRNATITTNWGGWTATALAQPIQKNATVATNWGTWTATGVVVFITHPAVVASNWGTWTATAVVGVGHSATISSTWGWTATAIATKTVPATVATNWGGWAATAVTVPDHPAVGIGIWGAASFTAAAGLAKVASISNDWSSWDSSVVGIVSKAGGAAIYSLWGNWDATAVAKRATWSTITTSWGGWNATAITAPDKKATITSAWGPGWNATAVAQAIQKNATISSNWGTWTATSIATPAHSATITTNWGGWTATALGSTGTGVLASISSNWGTWTTATIAKVERKATVTTSWGTWTATATGVAVRTGVISSNWGGWTAVAVVKVAHPAVIGGIWTTWAATAIAKLDHPARIATNWGGWTADAYPIKGSIARIDSNWDGWTAVGQPTVSHPSTVDTLWPKAVFTAEALALHEGRIIAFWGGWNAVAIGDVFVNGVVLNNADRVYLGDVAVDRVYLDGVVVWELV